MKLEILKLSHIGLVLLLASFLFSCQAPSKDDDPTPTSTTETQLTDQAHKEELEKESAPKTSEADQSKPKESKKESEPKTSDPKQAKVTEPKKPPFLSDEKFARVSHLFQSLIDDELIAGSVVLIAQNGKTVYERGLGYQDVEKKTAMTPDTIFRICSMTKPITSVAAMILYDRGQYALETPVSQFIPYFSQMRVAKVYPDGKRIEYQGLTKPINIRHLLSHTSGITYGFWGKEPQYKIMRGKGVSDGLIETPGSQMDNANRLIEVPLRFQPGTAWEYGLNTDVLGAVIEKVSGQNLEAFFKREILDPLEMKDTHFRLPEDKHARLATVYQPRNEDNKIEPIPDGKVVRDKAIYSTTYPMKQTGDFYSGGAGLVTTARDYAKFLNLLVRGGVSESGKRILQETTIKTMLTDHTRFMEMSITSHGDGFGLGFGLVTRHNKDQSLGSTGSYSWGGFYHTYFWVDPAEKVYGIYLTQLYPWGHLDLPAKFRKAVYESL